MLAAARSILTIESAGTLVRRASPLPSVIVIPGSQMPSLVSSARTTLVASAIDPGISIATVYRTVRLFEEAGILDRHDFGDGRARYEPSPEAHHDHLIDVETGKVIEFVDPELELLQKAIAERLGFRLVDHRMELYGVSLRRE